MAGAFSGAGHATNKLGRHLSIGGRRGRFDPLGPGQPLGLPSGDTGPRITGKLDQTFLPPTDTGAADAQARADAEQAAKNSSIATVNRIFGYQPGGAVDPNAAPGTSGGLRIFPDPNARPSSGVPASTPTCTWDPVAAANFAARTKSYADIAKAVQDYQQQPLDEQTAEAQRQTNFSLLRRGLGGGSEQIHQGNILDRARTAAMANIENLSTGASNSARSADEAS